MEVFGTTYCSAVCASEAKRKVKRPSKIELSTLLDNNSYVKVGKMFGVSDNAVRKWSQQYDMPS